MNGLIALPLVIVVVSILLAAPQLERLRPQAAVWGNVIALVALLAAAVPTLWLLGLGGLAHTGLRIPALDWCRHLLPEDRITGLIVGVLALVLAIAGSIRSVRVLALHRPLRTKDTCSLQMIETDDVFAFTLPGPAGTIAVSRGLRNSLDDVEFGVVIAHEQAHARHRHDRFLLIALLARAFVPPVASVSRGLEFHIERWTDEEALIESGACRVVAARTIAKVALAAVPVPAVLGVANHGTVARATALLQPAATPSRLVRLQALAATGLIVVVAALQVHHTTMLAAKLLA